MDDSDEALRKFGRAVLEMVKLYYLATSTGDRDAVKEFQLHVVLVEALAQVAVLGIVRCPDPEELK